MASFPVRPWSLGVRAKEMFSQEKMALIYWPCWSMKLHVKNHIYSAYVKSLSLGPEALGMLESNPRLTFLTLKSVTKP